MQNAAVRTARRQQRVEDRKLAMEEKARVAGKLKSHLASKGLDQAKIDDLQLDALFEVQEGIECGQTLNSPLNLQNKRMTETSEFRTTKKKKKESRNGNKEIKGRERFQYWTAKDKLEFIDQNADEEAGCYKNESRLWLLRVNPIAKCFQTCCERDVAVFLAKHGNQNGNFSVSAVSPKMVGCPNCKQLN